MSTANALTPDDLAFCKQFGILLRNRRKHYKMSQQELANKIGLRRQLVQSWESGKVRISLKKRFNFG